MFIYLAFVRLSGCARKRPASECSRDCSPSAQQADWCGLLYGVIPLLLIPTALGVNSRPQNDAVTGRISLWLAAISALAMMTGLLRWPTLQWSL